MKIAQVAPLIERIPPKMYGGTERIVHTITEELVQRGHDVTLFASGDSVTQAYLHSVYPRSLREARLKDMYGLNTFTMLNIGVAYDMQDQFDVIHDHCGIMSLPTANISKTPVVMTMHGPFTTENRVMFQTLKKPYQVTISNSQAYAVPALHHGGTIYNGLSMEDYPFSEEHDGYLLFVGRISMEKGVHHAIETAKTLDLPLIIAAKLDVVDKNYFQHYIEPRLTEQVKWIGEIEEAQRNKLMSRAIAFLHPVTWREPFGLTIIESMACGCPVVAFNRGSIPEIVKHNETGFVVEDIEGMVEAVQNIETINRRTCRDYALKNFNAAKMTSGYEEIYKKIINKEV